MLRNPSVKKFRNLGVLNHRQDTIPRERTAACPICLICAAAEYSSKSRLSLPVIRLHHMLISALHGMDYHNLRNDLL